jgi:acetyl-CoA carboxylase carboxyl transferase subunit alpha
LIDLVVKEPLGGAHRDLVSMAAALKRTIHEQLSELKILSTNELLDRRYKKLMAMGACD